MNELTFDIANWQANMAHVQKDTVINVTGIVPIWEGRQFGVGGECRDYRYCARLIRCSKGHEIAALYFALNGAWIEQTQPYFQYAVKDALSDLLRYLRITFMPDKVLFPGSLAFKQQVNEQCEAQLAREREAQLDADMTDKLQAFFSLKSTICAT